VDLIETNYDEVQQTEMTQDGDQLWGSVLTVMVFPFYNNVCCR